MISITHSIRLLLFALALGVFGSAYAKNEGTHKVSWERLEQFAGKYPSDKPVAGALTPAIRATVKSRYKVFERYFRVQVPIEISDGVAACAGMEPHSGGNNAAFAFFERSGKLLVVIKKGTQFEYFGAKELATLPFVARSLKTYS